MGRLIKVATWIVITALTLLLAGWWLPADLAYSWLAPRFGAVHLSGIHGSLHTGSADSLSVFGRELGRLDWRLQAQPLLRGRLLVEFRVAGAELDLDGALWRQGGALGLRGLQFRFPAKVVALNHAGAPELGGTVDGTLERAEFVGGGLREVRGSARWSEVGSPLTPDLQLPDLAIDFASEADGSVAGRLHDIGEGDLAVDGSFVLRIGGLEADIRLAARRDTDAALAALVALGESQPDGSSRIRLHQQWLRLP